MHMHQHGLHDAPKHACPLHEPDQAMPALMDAEPPSTVLQHSTTHVYVTQGIHSVLCVVLL
jgi:hypothetical protein